MLIFDGHGAFDFNYRSQRSWGKVMFLHVCVILFTGGCYPSMHCRWYPSMPCSRSPGGCMVPGGLLRGSAWWRPPPQDGYCCGRYASYWNAFLCKQTLKARFHVTFMYVSTSASMFIIMLVVTQRTNSWYVDTWRLRLRSTLRKSKTSRMGSDPFCAFVFAFPLMQRWTLRKCKTSRIGSDPFCAFVFAFPLMQRWTLRKCKTSRIGSDPFCAFVFAFPLMQRWTLMVTLTKTQT